MDETLRKNCQEALAKMTITIGKQLSMEKNGQVFMMMMLNTPEKIKKFSDWARARTVDDKINSTPMKVLSAATRIGRGMEPLD